jgi:hypothetical protein
MKEDSLERMVRENRDAFDHHTPSDKAWKAIAGTVFGRETISLWNSVSVWRAAAVVLLGLSVYLFVSGQRSVAIPGMSSVQQEFRDVESYYSAQISEKVAFISKEGFFADDSFTQDIQKLEAMYTVLAEEMKRHPSEKVKDAMVLNMIVRIDLLNQQIQKLEDVRRPNEEAAAI